MEVTWNVEGMTCQHCVRAVENAVKPFGSARVSLQDHTARLDLAEGTDLGQVKAAIEEEGYRVREAGI